MLSPHARTDHARGIRVAEPQQRAGDWGRDSAQGHPTPLTTVAGHHGTASHHPRGTQPPQGVQAKGTVLGPHTRTPHSQHMGSGPRQPGWRAGGRSRGST